MVAPLTNLLKKSAKYIWSEECSQCFEKVKIVLISAPVLAAPDFTRPFKLATDASDVGVGSVLLQEDDQNVDHPVCYFSKKLNRHQQHYSTVEKEALALILALQHFEVYLEAATPPIVVYRS